MPPVRGRFWRSLEELADDPDFLARAGTEFPGLADVLASPAPRRRVLQLMGAALAIGGLSACTEPRRDLIPPVQAADNTVAGIPDFYATASLSGGYARGVLVKHVMGRPIKIEGNPRHPASLGATDAVMQAEILDFYDPDRDCALTYRGNPASPADLADALAEARAAIAMRRGEGFRILTGPFTSPTQAAQIDRLLTLYPGAVWHGFDPLARSGAAQGSQLAYGAPHEVLARFGKADVILSIDGDFLDLDPGAVRYARDFATRRNPTRGPMSRVYAVESTPTLAGAVADHRFIADPGQIHAGVLALAARLRNQPAPAEAPAWVEAVAADLQAHRGRALIHAGASQPAEIHALVFAMNEALGGRGQTFDLIAAQGYAPAHRGTLEALAADMHAGRVSHLLILDSNPVYAAPDLDFAAALARVPFALAGAPAPSETTAQAGWFVPLTHPFETWSDARAYDGTATILQPQSLPLFGATSPHTLLALFETATPPSPLAQVQSTWRGHLGGNFDKGWHDCLASGVIPNTAAPIAATKLLAAAAPSSAAPAVTLLLRPDPYLTDGARANNAWLQELPRPLTRLTWDNPLLIAPADADRLGIKNGDMVRLSAGGTKLTLPAWIMPGQAPGVIVGTLGFGRTVGSVAAGAGWNLYPFRNTTAAHLEKADGHVRLASVEHHTPIFGADDDIIRHGTLAEFMANPRAITPEKPTPALYRWPPSGPAEWGMSIDLNACIGCNACVVACQSENNIPTVGRDEVLREREMHWLRIDRAWEGAPEDPSVEFEPMLCQHCEQAPCEPVCPVGATMHDSEGLNVMVYNRCVGTRFCSNNCPYKVRRFNYFAFTETEPRPAEARNPDVTVRARGVMEKCTFCLQRIAAARIAADISDGPTPEVVTACQAACPTQAFTFGNLADPRSAVVARKHSPLTFAVLENQGTRPRVTYEAHIRNPNPDVEV